MLWNVRDQTVTNDELRVLACVCLCVRMFYNYSPRCHCCDALIFVQFHMSIFPPKIASFCSNILVYILWKESSIFAFIFPEYVVDCFELCSSFVSLRAFSSNLCIFVYVCPSSYPFWYIISYAFTTIYLSDSFIELVSAFILVFLFNKFTWIESAYPHRLSTLHFVDLKIYVHPFANAH